MELVSQSYRGARYMIFAFRLFVDPWLQTDA
jgi:hypothetical protein